MMPHQINHSTNMYCRPYSKSTADMMPPNQHVQKAPMMPADVSFPPSLKRVAIVNNMPEVPDNKPILAKEKKKDDFEIASKTDYYNGNAAIATESLAEALAHENS